jgi:arylsulfatase A-like enzyme
MIFEPGQKVRVDVNLPTSAIDLLPTLAHVTGGEIPPWTEGDILPTYNPNSGSNSQEVYALQSKGTKKHEPLQRATAMLVRENYKLTKFWGYEESEDDMIELYNLADDPEELNNLAYSEIEKTKELLAILNGKLDEVERRRTESKG